MSTSEPEKPETLTTTASTAPMSARGLLQITRVSVWVWAAFGVAYWIGGSRSNATVDFVMCGLAWALWRYLSRAFGARERAGTLRSADVMAWGHVALCLATAGLFSVCTLNGQSQAPGVWFFALLPLIAVHIGGLREGFVWSVGAVLAIAGLHLSELAVHIEPETHLSRVGSFLNQVSLVVSVMLFARTYLRIVQAHVQAVMAREAVIVEQSRELADARDAALEAARLKSEFLANMSHEIRTPMNAVLGYADLLIADDLGAALREEHARTIRKNGEHLLSLLDDVLDLSKLEAGRMRVEAIACRPHAILTDVMAFIRPRAESMGLALSLVEATPLPERITTDPTRLRQILLNLLSNAVKFTRRGSVSIEVRCEAPESARPRMRFDVRDTGVGLTDDEIARLFQPFSQADSSTTRRFGGTGLGLSISQRLASLLGGEITVQSRPGEGSTFTLTIDTGPLTGVAMRSPGSLSSADITRPVPALLPKLRGTVLVVEDVAVNQKLLSIILETAGATVSLAENGRLALDRVHAQPEPFDLILMDMQMPEMDGYEATRTLRREGYAHPVVALTAHAMADDRTRCLDAGCDDYLTKPIDRGALLRLAARYLGDRERELEPTPLAITPSQR